MGSRRGGVYSDRFGDHSLVSVMCYGSSNSGWTVDGTSLARVQQIQSELARGLNGSLYNQRLFNPMIAGIYSGQEAFMNHPITRGAINTMFFIATGGIEGIAALGGGIARLAGRIAKGEVKGGLNLFKWGAEQTTKSTGWRNGDYMLHLPNKGTPKLNWKANYGALRQEMQLGRPIYDSYRLPNGNLIPTGGFLNAERVTLQSRGWIYNPNIGAWTSPLK